MEPFEFLPRLLERAGPVREVPADLGIPIKREQRIQILRHEMPKHKLGSFENDRHESGAR